MAPIITRKGNFCFHPVTSRFVFCYNILMIEHKIQRMIISSLVFYGYFFWCIFLFGLIIGQNLAMIMYLVGYATFLYFLWEKNWKAFFTALLIIIFTLVPITILFFVTLFEALVTMGRSQALGLPVVYIFLVAIVLAPFSVLYAYKKGLFKVV